VKLRLILSIVYVYGRGNKEETKIVKMVVLGAASGQPPGGMEFLVNACRCLPVRVPGTWARREEREESKLTTV
jgi:hypothetical protein